MNSLIIQFLAFGRRPKKTVKTSDIALSFFNGTPSPSMKIIHIIISYPDAGLGHCPEGQGPDIKHKF